MPLLVFSTWALSKEFQFDLVFSSQPSSSRFEHFRISEQVFAVDAVVEQCHVGVYPLGLILEEDGAKWISQQSVQCTALSEAGAKCSCRCILLLATDDDGGHIKIMDTLLGGEWGMHREW